MIKIKCHGAYYYRQEAQKGIKNYEMTVNAASLGIFEEHSFKYIGCDNDGKQQFAERKFLNVRGKLKKRLLPILLAKKYPDFARVRYVVIDEITGPDVNLEELPLQLKSRRQLAEIVRRESIPVNPEEYFDIDELRTDIMEYRVNPETWHRFKSIRDKRRAEEQQFRLLNDIAEEQELPPEKPRSGIIDL